MKSSEPRWANVVGLGLIGASIALALKGRGYMVAGSDRDDSVAAEALSRGIIDAIDLVRECDVTVVATPVTTIAREVERALQATTGIVTDVGSVKGHVSATVTDGRFVPGHPMAGSELDGLDGADAAMFEGAVWVLTPTAATTDDAFAFVAGLVTGMGAEVVALDAVTHDEVVAIVSHVPHLTAATLMQVADDHSEEHLALLRLAAGGFRDMTRIASGRPGIWIDICDQNRSAILKGLDAVIGGLVSMREIVANGDSAGLLARLDRARRARMNLPASAGPTEDLSEVRIPIPDRPGASADVFTLSGQLGVNIYDFEVVHSIEGDRGVIVTVVSTAHADTFRGGLLARGFRPAVQPLS